MALKRTPAFYVSSSHVGRANPMRRMGSRRFTRLTDAFSEKVENHAHPVAVHTMHCDSAGIRKTACCTPAMAADVVDGPCELADMQVSRKREARGTGAFGR